MCIIIHPYCCFQFFNGSIIALDGELVSYSRAISLVNTQIGRLMASDAHMLCCSRCLLAQFRGQGLLYFSTLCILSTLHYIFLAPLICVAAQYYTLIFSFRLCKDIYSWSSIGTCPFHDPSWSHHCMLQILPVLQVYTLSKLIEL